MEERIDEGIIIGAKKPKPIKGTELEEMEKCICKIKGKAIGMGFFCKIKNKDELIPVLMTCFHIIDDNFIEQNKNLELYIKDLRKILKIDKNRKIYSSERNKFDIMIIRLNQEDGINDYLEIDENIFSKDSENSYNDEPIYILHKPIKNTLISYGKGIEIINEYDIKHKCSTLNGSSGGPILNQITHKVLGIHKGYIKKKKEKENFNIGTFLKYPLNQILLIYVTKNINIKNNKNEENNKNNINKNTESNIKEYSNNNNISNSSNKKKPKFFSPKFYESLKRIKEEYKELDYNPNSNIGLSVGLFEEDNYFEWRITIIGGKDTLYEGGLFFLKLKLPEDYPNKPPKILFLTPIYHINIPSIKNNYFEIGNINADFLNWWTLNRTIKEVLIKLFSIFYLSNIDCKGCEI